MGLHLHNVPTNNNEKNVRRTCKGTAQANLSPIETGKMEIQIPPKELLQKYSPEATPLLEKVLKNKNQINTTHKTS